MEPQPHLVIDVVPDRERLVLATSGELDLWTAPQLRAALTDAIHAGWDEVVVDLRGLEFMDAQGVHTLLDAHADALRAGGRVSYVDGVPAVARVTALVALARDVPVAELPCPRTDVA